MGGSIGEGLKATNIGIHRPGGIGVDPRNGKLYYVDINNFQVKYVDTDGSSHYFAGSLVYQSRLGSDGLSFANDTFLSPYALAVNSKGEVFVSDILTSNRIKKVFYNSTLDANMMITYAGGGSLTTTGIPATFVQFTTPTCVAVSPSDEIYICDKNVIQKVVANGTLFNVVGNGVSGSSPEGTLALNAQIVTPYGIAFHPKTGEMYFTTSNAILYVSSNGSLFTYASISMSSGLVFNSNGDLFVSESSTCRIYKYTNGTSRSIFVNSVGLSGFSGDGGLAFNAQLGQPTDLAIYGNNLYISDSASYRIRKVDLSSNIITTVAGDGTERYQGGMSGTKSDISLTPVFTYYNSQTDELLAVDNYLNRVLKLKSLSRYNTSSIETIAGTGIEFTDTDGKLGNQTSLAGAKSVIRSEKTGDIFIGTMQLILKLSQDQRISIFAGTRTLYSGDGYSAIYAQFGNPIGLAISPITGDIYFSDSANFNVRKITVSSGIISTIVGNQTSGYSDGPGLSSMLLKPSGLAFLPNGDLLIADGSRIRKYSQATGMVSTIAGTSYVSFNGDGILAVNANVNNPEVICVDQSNGNIYIQDKVNARIRRIINATGIMDTIIGTGFTAQSPDGFVGDATNIIPYGIAIHPITKDIYFSDGTYNSIRRFEVSNGKIVTVIGGGSSYSTNSLANSTYLGTSGSYLTFSPNGDLFISIPNLKIVKKMDYGTNVVYDIAGLTNSYYFNGDGQATSTYISQNSGIVSAANGEVIFTDSSQTFGKIRKVSNGVVNTIAGSNGDGSLATNAFIRDISSMALTDTDLYLSDRDNDFIRKISLSTGIISTVAGTIFTVDNGDNLANSTILIYPNDIRIRNGEVIFTDSNHHKIRKTSITGRGPVVTIAGIGFGSGYSENVLATNAYLSSPYSIDYLSNGELIIADTFNHIIRKVDLNGNITTIAGSYRMKVFNGDSFSNARLAFLNKPQGISVLKDGRIIFADSDNLRVRMLTPYCVEGYTITQTSSGGVCSPNINTCFGIQSNDSKVCSGNGICSSNNICTCNQGYYDSQCSSFNCAGGISMNLCLNNGTCPAPGECICTSQFKGPKCEYLKCAPNWFGEDCSVTTCFNKFSNSSSVCSGRGVCNNYNVCQCSAGYSGLDCSKSDICAVSSGSYVCSSQFTTTETVVAQVSNLTQLDSKVIQFTSTQSISVSLPSSISKYLESKDSSLRNDSIQVISSLSTEKKSDTPVISSVVSLILLKSSSSSEISIQNLPQPISFSFNTITLTLQNIESLNISCSFYDEQEKRWKSDGIETKIQTLSSINLPNGNITLTLSITCQTSHLTSFGIIDQNYKNANSKSTTTRDDSIILNNTTVLIAAIVGSVGGVCVLLTITILVGVVICLCLRKKRK